MLFLLNFVKFMGNFCKMFAAYRLRFLGFSLSNRWYSAFVAYHNKLLVSLKSFRSYRFKNLSGVIKWNMLNFMAIVYVLCGHLLGKG